MTPSGEAAGFHLTHKPLPGAGCWVFNHSMWESLQYIMVQLGPVPFSGVTRWCERTQMCPVTCTSCGALLRVCNSDLLFSLKVFQASQTLLDYMCSFRTLTGRGMSWLLNSPASIWEPQIFVNYLHNRANTRSPDMLCPAFSMNPRYASILHLAQFHSPSFLFILHIYAEPQAEVINLL